MPRLWYPSRADVEELAYTLAAELFDEERAGLPAFKLFGGDVGGGLLESALALPRQTFQGKPLYRSIYDKAGVLLRSIIKNHPFVDGNKRIAVSTTVVFLFINRHLFLATDEEMLNFALDVARSEPDMPWPQVSEWIRMHTLPILDVQKGLRHVKATLGPTEEVLQRVMDRWVDMFRWQVLT